MTDRVEQLESMLKDEPNDPFLLYSLAQEYAKRGDSSRAITYFDRTLAADANYCYAYFHKARVLEEDDRIDEAIEVLKAGLHTARACNDAHAADEIGGFLSEMTP